MPQASGVLDSTIYTPSSSIPGRNVSQALWQVGRPGQASTGEPHCGPDLLICRNGLERQGQAASYYLGPEVNEQGVGSTHLPHGQSYDGQRGGPAWLVHGGWGQELVSPPTEVPAPSQD